MNLDKSLSTPLTFLWWFLTELSLFSSFANDDDYLIVRLLEALSWIRFFIYYWVVCLQWSIHTGAQNSNCNSVKASMLYLFSRTFKNMQYKQEHFEFFTFLLHFSSNFNSGSIVISRRIAFLLNSVDNYQQLSQRWLLH